MGAKDDKKRVVEVVDSRYQPSKAELEMDTGLPDDVTLEELDAKAVVLAKALMGDKRASGEGRQERA